jgi:AraC family transcriptional regulator of adaptative response / DNA-3-methyladenine glycosylase II
MELISAVVTTGIYCRPGCSAQPRSENVRTYYLAAAAEAAGYRACLRCRPYRMAVPAAWSGPELVCRGVQLILDGALDDGREHDLGVRLGISGRHLRRLFVTHLGVTPDGLARSARTHFARRLLDDTDLTVTEIAFAAGFGSLRQFNRAFREIFRAAPLELRVKRRKTDRLVADGGLVIRLPFRGPLDWAAMVDYFAERAIPGVEDASDGTYRRTVVVRDDPGVLELEYGGPDHLILRAHLPHWEELIHVAGRARRIANLEFDLDAATHHLSRDPLIGPMLRARPGMRPPGTWDPYETGVRAIIGQQDAAAAASTIIGRLVERHGMPVAGLAQLRLTHTFPTAETVARADLRDLGMTRATTSAVKAFARGVAAGMLRLDGSVGLDRLVSSVLDLGGIDRTTAHYIALRLGEPDAFPASDPRPLWTPLTGVDGSVGGAEELTRAWRPWRALAATHLAATAREQRPIAQVGVA